jgi:hypothetical protein
MGFCVPSHWRTVLWPAPAAFCLRMTDTNIAHFIDLRQYYLAPGARGHDGLIAVA